MAKRIGLSTYQVAPGITVQPIYGDNERRNGWQVVVKGEYCDDFCTKKEAVDYALGLVGQSVVISHDECEILEEV